MIKERYINIMYNLKTTIAKLFQIASIRSASRRPESDASDEEEENDLVEGLGIRSPTHSHTHINLRELFLRRLWRLHAKVLDLHLLFEHLVLFCLLNIRRHKVCFNAEAQKWVFLIDDLGPYNLEHVDLVNTELARHLLDLEVRRQGLAESTADQEVSEGSHFESVLLMGQTSIEDREELGPDALELLLQLVDGAGALRELDQVFMPQEGGRVGLPCRGPCLLLWSELQKMCT